MKQPTVFLVEEDKDTRTLFKRILTNNGYSALLAIDESDALERISGERGAINVILINLLRASNEQMLTAGRRIRAKGGLNVPLVAIAEEYDAHLEGKNVQVGENEYVTYLEDGTELFDLLSSLTKNSGGEISELKEISS